MSVKSCIIYTDLIVGAMIDPGFFGTKNNTRYETGNYEIYGNYGC